MEHFGKYEVIEQIGVGGFGEVFKGFDPDIKRYLAIKTCTSNDDTIRSRFQQEAKIAGNLHHPNITTIYDFGIQDDVPYLAQELLTGRDLDRMIAGDEPIPLADKLRYLRQIAGGLAFAHSRGVVHRDVKPANIHILKDGTVKILDFGIARLMHEDIGLTKTGTTVGTAAYLAPEQVQGEKIDQRTDIFSFGVMAYELLSDVKPFQGDTFSNVIYRILSEEPAALREVSPECPPDVADLVERCMAKRPIDRPQNCGEIQEQLPDRDFTAVAAVPEDRLAHVAVKRPEAPEDRRQRAFPAWGWGLGFVVLAAAAFGLYTFLPRGEEAVLEPERESLVADEALPATQPAEPEVDPLPADHPPTLPIPEKEPAEPVSEAAPEPEPVVAPPAAKANLTISQAWSDDMTVSVDGGDPRPLLRDWTWELTAGSHTLVYRLDTPDYTAFERETVNLRAGEAVTLTPSIAVPGRLSVQPALRTPQGLVQVGDDRTGHSPLTARVRPGSYTIVIEALSGGYDSITLDVEIASGEWSVVTFDLTRAAETFVESRAAPER